MKGGTGKFKVVITGPRVAEEAMQLLEKSCDVECLQAYLQPEELAVRVAGSQADGMLVRVSSIDQEKDAAYALQNQFAIEMIQAISPEHRNRFAGDAIPK